ncbi:MAG: crotonase/enoyl-CoA hydratase family protein [bacterium]|nr:crotonase/enoyl-CoA hydratase family protein [bacterium]
MSDLLFEKSGRIATLTLNRPDRKNAMSPQMLVLLADAWLEIERDDAIRVVILSAAGSEFFCPGGDLDSLVPVLTGKQEPADEWERRFRDEQTEVARVAFLNPHAFDKPIVAAVNGDALSAGCELLQATDIRIASRAARFGLFEVKRGLIPAGGSLAKLQQQIPYCRAAQLILQAEAISADEAQSIGLVGELVDRDRVLERAREVAERLAGFDPAAVQKSKQTLRRTRGLPEEEACLVQQICFDEFMAEQA